MTNLAYELPARSPRVPLEAPEQTRHIEIVSTRQQRRARPRAVYALVTVAGLFLILMAQLLLSIWLSDGAYRIAALQTTQTNLTRDQQTLSEQLNVLRSPQSLSARAQALGMVMSNAPAVYLRLSDGAIIGQPTQATAGNATSVSTGTSLIPNSLIPADSALPTAGSAADAGATPTTGTPTSGTATAAPAAGATTGTSASGNGAGGASTGASAAGAPSGTSGTGSVASNPGALQAPVTH
ncbi:MAG: hypothetical protein QOD27_576 [Microbacteriaceae bacterium]|jgi:hypothetical protein|nr:hypothetical protein [Microbacteriaceae bacterium]MDQ1553726.1 hypothetical protein [Microbacteriaceae bacterium]MDQ1577797.1 hypothetical protein [Microbacteriaceae bacterium]